jgi:hypothetical protein
MTSRRVKILREKLFGPKELDITGEELIEESALPPNFHLADYEDMKQQQTKSLKEGLLRFLKYADKKEKECE